MNNLIGKDVKIIASFKDKGGLCLMGERGIVDSINSEDLLEINAFYYKDNKRVDRRIVLPYEFIKVIHA